MRTILASQSPARYSTLVSAGITPIVILSHVDEDAVLANLPGGRFKPGGSTTPEQEVLALAAAKCRSVAEGLRDSRFPLPGYTPSSLEEEIPPEDPCEPPVTPKRTSPIREKYLLIGCDSMLELDGEMIGKPHSPELARERLLHMRSREATLWTGHHLILMDRSENSEQTTFTNSFHEEDSEIALSALEDSDWSICCEAQGAGSTQVIFGDISDDEINAYVDSEEPLHVAGSFTVDGLGGPFITGIRGDFHNVVGLSLPLVRTLASKLGIFWPDLWDNRQKIS